MKTINSNRSRQRDRKVTLRWIVARAALVIAIALGLSAITYRFAYLAKVNTEILVKAWPVVLGTIICSVLAFVYYRGDEE